MMVGMRICSRVSGAGRFRLLCVSRYSYRVGQVEERHLDLGGQISAMGEGEDFFTLREKG